MAFDWTSLIGPAIQAGSNYWAGNQLGKGSEAAAASADPFAQFRPGYAQALAQLQADPSRVAQTPGYRFSQDESMKALERSGAAKGMLGSGNLLAAIQQRGSDLASQQFDTERDFLAKASGAYLNPATAAQMALAGRQGQLGAYGEGLGTLMAGGGQGGLGGSLGGLAGQALQSYFGGGGAGAAGEAAAGGGGGGNILSSLSGGAEKAYNYLFGSGAGAGSTGAATGGAGAYNASVGTANIPWTSGYDVATGGQLGTTAGAEAGAGAAGSYGGLGTLAPAMAGLGGIALVAALGQAMTARKHAKEDAGAMRTYDRLIAAGASPDELSASRLFVTPTDENAWNIGRGTLINNEYANQLAAKYGVDRADLETLGRTEEQLPGYWEYWQNVNKLREAQGGAEALYRRIHGTHGEDSSGGGG